MAFKLSPRDAAKQQFAEFMARGGIPIIETETKAGFCSVNISIDDYGVFFDYSFSEDFDYDKNTPFFDGCIKKRKGVWVISWAEVDRNEYSLDQTLELINDNVNDGIIGAYNLYP